MTRLLTVPAARRSDRPAEAMVVAIPEDAFHRARAAATAHTNTFAGETFITADALFARVNDRHFRIEGQEGLTHPQGLALVGRQEGWQQSAER